MSRSALMIGVVCCLLMCGACKQQPDANEAGVQAAKAEGPNEAKEASDASLTWVDVPNEVCDSLIRHGREEGEKIAADFGSRACGEKKLSYAAKYRCEGHAQVACR